MRFVCILLIAICRLSAQDPVIRVNVKQVLVPVTVADKKGHSIKGLHASDFQLMEDGVPQEIVAFSKETAASVTSAAVPNAPPRSASTGNTPETANRRPAGDAAAPRITVICFDASHSSLANAGRARAAIEQLFDKGGKGGDLFVLITLGRQLRVIQTATNDLSVIRAKLNSKEFTNIFAGSETPQLVNALNDVKRRMDDYCAKCACGRAANNQKDPCDIERQQIKQDLDARSEQFAMFTSAFLAGLKGMVEELAKIEAHRTLVLVSDGFTLMPGNELYATAAAYLPNSPYFQFDPARNMQHVLNESLKVAAAHNIVVSTIDTRGVYSPSFGPGGMSDASNAGPGATGRQEMLSVRGKNGTGPTDSIVGGTVMSDMDSKWSSVEHDKGSVLAQLAETTGGIYFHDNNDLLKGLREVLEDKSEAYVLAYVSKNPAADGKFRRITVSVNAAGVKPADLVVRSKSGYWAEPEADKQ